MFLLRTLPRGLSQSRIIYGGINCLKRNKLRVMLMQHVEERLVMVDTQ